MAKSKNSDAFKILYEMMKGVGAWPEENETVSYKIKGILSYLCVVLLLITMLIEAYNDLNNFTKLSEILYILVTVMAYLFKHPTFYLQRKTFIRMINLLKDPIFSSYPDELDYLMVERIKSSRLLINVYRYLVFTCVILMSVTPFFDQHKLPFPFPYELGNYTFLMYVVQVVGIAMLGWINPCFDTLLGSLIGIAATHLDILSKKIILLSKDNHLEVETSSVIIEDLNDIVINKLKQCVQHHMAIIEYVECIEHVFSLIILEQFIGSAIIICNTLFHFVLISVKSSQFFVLTNYLTNSLMQLFIYCWFGNEILLKSSNVCDACYTFNWYHENSLAAKYLFLIMERSKRPSRITAFNFSTLSLNAFTSIMRWSYSYYTLLMNLYQKQDINSQPNNN